MARSARSARPSDAADPEITLQSFVAKFDATRQRLITDIRAALRRRFPSAHELVWDNYNFFVIGYSPSERPSDAPISMAASAAGVSLCFIHGATLADPAGLLSGAGKQTRFLRLSGASDLDRPDVDELLTRAVAHVSETMRHGPPGSLIIRSVSAKQRQRRRPES